MTFPTFTPPVEPSPGTTERPEFRLLRAEFGDGYSQITRDGLNHNRATVSLVWEVLTRPEHDAIVSFLTARGGDETFFYTVPGEPLRKWTCAEWESNHAGAGYLSLTATLKQSFAIAQY